MALNLKAPSRKTPAHDPEAPAFAELCNAFIANAHAYLDDIAGQEAQINADALEEAQAKIDAEAVEGAKPKKAAVKMLKSDFRSRPGYFLPLLFSSVESEFLDSASQLPLETIDRFREKIPAIEKAEPFFTSLSEKAAYRKIRTPGRTADLIAKMLLKIASVDDLAGLVPDEMISKTHYELAKKQGRLRLASLIKAASAARKKNKQQVGGKNGQEAGAGSG